MVHKLQSDVSVLTFDLMVGIHNNAYIKGRGRETCLCGMLQSGSFRCPSAHEQRGQVVFLVLQQNYFLSLYHNSIYQMVSKMFLLVCLLER